MPCHPATMSWQACLDNDLPLSGARHWLPCTANFSFRDREGQHSLGLKASWSQKGSSSPICSWIAASFECKIAGRWQSMHSDQGPSSQAENLCFKQISASWIEMSKFHRTTWSGVGTGWILPWVPFLPTPSPWPRCVPGLAKISIARAPRWAWMSLCSFFFRGLVVMSQGDPMEVLRSFSTLAEQKFLQSIRKRFWKQQKRCESNRLPMLLSTFFLCYAKVTYPSEIKRRSRRSCRWQAGCWYGSIWCIKWIQIISLRTIVRRSGSLSYPRIHQSFKLVLIV